MDEDGNVAATYKYDAWGNWTVSGGDVGTYNSFRYRGYYYDTAVMLYYLKTRYYDPETGRFISPDSINYLAPQSINGLNLYAYCLNNPVMYVDPTGESFILAMIIGGAIAGAIIGATVNGVTAYSEGVRGWDLAGAIVAGAAVGGIAGGIIGAGVGTLFGGAAVGGALAIAGGGTAAAGAAISASAAGTAVLTGLAAGIGIGAGIFFAQWIPGSWPGDDPTVPPGDGFEWRGPSEPGGKYGDWYNPNTHDALHPDLNHPLPKGPHWDWRNKLLRIIRDIFKGA